ncbi:phage adaptor protein [Cytobacillus praedii]|uniref:phage adaptor protein n=1 Tax=Cytobacillus praedii TaxID=1742358 RepID=UPI000709ECB8|nr:hypothetical protein [Cytobacillus praedii]
MKLSELIKEVNKDIDDSLSNAEITQWLNRGLDDLTPYVKHQKHQTYEVIADQSKYPLPTDLVNIVYLFDESNKRVNLVQFDDFSSTGYKMWGNDLILQPTPKLDSEMNLYYHARLPRLVNPDDIPVLPEQYHDLLVLYAVAKAKYQDEELEMQSSAWSDYLRRKDEFITFNQSNEIYTIQEVYW